MTRAAFLAMLVLIAIVVRAPRLAGAEGELTVRIEAVDDGTGTAVVTVLGADGRPVVGLAAASFEATDAGQDALVTSVTRAEDASIGIAVVLAIDTSRSMELVIGAAQTGAGSVVSGLGPEDQAAILAFSRTVETAQPLTTDAAALDAALDSLVAVGSTALYDAVLAAIEVARDAPLDRRVVILLTDGFDEGSSATRAAALAAAAADGVPVYAIGFGASTDEAFLRDIAAASNGSFLLAPDAAAMLVAYEEFASVLRSQYVVAFEPTPATTEATRALEVAVTLDGVTATASREYTSTRPLLPVVVPTAQPEVVVAPPVAPPAVVATPAPVQVTAPASSGSQPPLAVIGAAAAVLAVVAVALTVRRRRRITVMPPLIRRAASANGTPDALGGQRDAGVTRTTGASASLHPLGDEAGREHVVAEGDLLVLRQDGSCATGRAATASPAGAARVWWRDGKLMLHQRPSPGDGTSSSWATLESGDVIEIGPQQFSVVINRESTSPPARSPEESAAELRV